MTFLFLIAQEGIFLTKSISWLALFSIRASYEIKRNPNQFDERLGPGETIKHCSSKNLNNWHFKQMFYCFAKSQNIACHTRFACENQKMFLEVFHKHSY